jgi:hypothetical protein
MPKHPNITVRLVGEDGNIYAIMARVTRALRGAGAPRDEQKAFQDAVTTSRSYDEALGVVMSWVDTE